MASDPSSASPQPPSLSERIRDGDAAAEEAFARAFEGRVAAMLRARLWDHEAARELRSEVLMAAIVALRAGRLREGERLGAFVHGIARNLANNYLRRKGGQPRLEPLAAESLVADPRTLDDGRAETLREVIAKLEPADQAILRAVAEGHRSVDVARQLGLTSETVRARKHRALKKIARLLEAPSRSERRGPQEG